MANVRLVRCVGWLLLLVSTEAIGWAQMYIPRDSVDFRGAHLQLGMTIDEVTTALGERQLQLWPLDVKRGNVLRIVDGDGKVLGRLRFAAGKIFSISKDFNLQSNAAGTLVSLLQKLMDEGKRNCALESATNTDTTRDLHVAYISCGATSIKIYHRTTSEPMNAIEEVLER